jgi:hypothetical protein
VASIKSYCDGIADACGVNDAAWVWNAPVINAPVMPGSVAVTLAKLD